MEYLEQLRHAGFFDARVPRYTSYPPVSRLRYGEGRLNHKNWLNAVPFGSEVSVYLHIPFCEKLCWFCACRTQETDSGPALSAYLERLKEEILLIRAALPKQIHLSRLYLGGGTPTLVDTVQLAVLLDCVYSAFPKSQRFEFSVEIDATNIEETQLRTLVANGMTRAIIGAQDFDPKVQKNIGRTQSFEQLSTTVHALRSVGLQDLDIELLYGLPGQTAATLADTTQQVLALDPDRVSVCEYAHIPLVAKRQIMIDARALPASEDAFVTSQVARQLLLSDGYEAAGVDHFARPGDALITARDRSLLRRDFQGYSDNASATLIGIGASAISRFSQGYVQNASSTSHYSETIKSHQLASDRGFELTQQDRVIGCMIEMLLCGFQIDISGVRQSYQNHARFIGRGIKSIEAVFGRHVMVTADHLRIKPAARPLARLMANILDQLGNEDSAI